MVFQLILIHGIHFMSLGLTMHATILAYMFSLVELGRITVPFSPAHDNTLYVQEFVASLLRAAFPHLSDNQIKITVQGLFNLDQDIPAFKEHLRDFLVQIRVRYMWDHFFICSCWLLLPVGLFVVLNSPLR